MSTKLLGVAAVLCVLALAASFVFAGSGYRTLHAGEGSGISFDSRSKTPVFERTDSFDGAIKDFNASMQFQSYSTKGYPNLFQTGPVNTGIRAELNGSVLALIVGAKNAAGYDPLVITTTYDASVPHSLNVRFDQTNHVYVTFDGQETDFARPDLNYALSDVIVGAGLSKARPFAGRITNFAYSLGYYEPTGSLAVLTWVRVALGVAFLVLAMLFLHSSNLRLSKILPGLVESSHDEA